jgi:hypothetical protein
LRVPAWWARFSGDFESPTALSELLDAPLCAQDRVSTFTNSFLLSLYLYFVVGDGLVSAPDGGLAQSYATVVFHRCGIAVQKDTVPKQVRRVWDAWGKLAKSSSRGLDKMSTFLEQQHVFQEVALSRDPVRAW